MTALKQYQRLECPGIWRADDQAQRRNVIVTFGDASLVLTDRSESPLTHWSLPALIRQNPGELPALYLPGPDATESLEIEDSTMIEAIETIQRAVSRGRPKPGLLRLLVSAGGLTVIAAILLLILPGVLIRHTAAVAPQPLRAEIGTAVLDRIARVSGAPCTSAGGQIALDRLARFLFTPAQPKLVVLPAGIATTAHLPGDILLLNRALVEDFETPETVAGYLLAEDQRRRDLDPLKDMLRVVGPVASFRLLTTGRLPPKALNAYAEHLAADAPAPIADDVLLSRFAEAGVSSRPYAYAIDMSGETTLGLIEADPSPKAKSLILSDADWVRLQSICEN